MIATQRTKLPAGAASHPLAAGDWWQGLSAPKPNYAAKNTTTAAQTASPTSTPAAAPLNWWETPHLS